MQPAKSPKFDEICRSIESDKCYFNNYNCLQLLSLVTGDSLMSKEKPTKQAHVIIPLTDAPSEYSSLGKVYNIMQTEYTECPECYRFFVNEARVVVDYKGEVFFLTKDYKRFIDDLHLDNFLGKEMVRDI